MVVEDALGAGVDLGRKDGFREPKAGFEELGVVIPRVLVGSLLFAVVSLKMESLSGLLAMVELY